MQMLGIRAHLSLKLFTLFTKSKYKDSIHTFSDTRKYIDGAQWRRSARVPDNRSRACGDRCMPYSQGISGIYDLNAGLQLSLHHINRFVQKVVTHLLEAQPTRFVFFLSH